MFACHLTESPSLAALQPNIETLGTWTIRLAIHSRPAVPVNTAPRRMARAEEVLLLSLL